MGAHPQVFVLLGQDIARTKDRNVQDEVLDRWWEYQNLATDWDADQWGFNPDTWMLAERTELAKRRKKATGPSRRLDRGVA